MYRNPRLKRVRRGDPILAEQYNALIDEIPIIMGPGVTRIGNVYNVRPAVGVSVFDLIDARITGWAVWTTNKWKYAWEEIEVDGSGNVSAKTGGRSGTTSSYFAINMKETNNVASGGGVQGNDVDDSHADFPSGYDLVPLGAGTGGVPANKVLVALMAYVLSDGTPCYKIYDKPTMDGGCS